MEVAINRQRSKRDYMAKIVELNSRHRPSPVRKQRLVVHTSEAIYVLQLDEITYIKAENNYSVIHFEEMSKLLVSKSLVHFERELCSTNDFIRTHKSYIVNVNRIRSVCHSGEIEMDGTQIGIPLSRRKKKQIMQHLITI